MSGVPREIMNRIRMDLHASPTIISANHPDAQPRPKPPEPVSVPPEQTLLRRTLGRFTFSLSSPEAEES